MALCKDQAAPYRFKILKAFRQFNGKLVQGHVIVHESVQCRQPLFFVTLEFFQLLDQCG